MYVSVRADARRAARCVARCRSRPCSATRTAPTCSSSAATARSRSKHIKTDTRATATGSSPTASPTAIRSSCPACQKAKPGQPAKATPWQPATRAGTQPATKPQRRRAAPDGAAKSAGQAVRRRDMSSFFIDRPIFAWVIAILITLGGVIAIAQARRRVVSQHRAAAGRDQRDATRAPSADTIEKTVTQVIEQQLTGIDHLLYFSSTSSSNGGRIDHADVRDRHRSRHRAGADAEQGLAGDAAPAGRSDRSRASSVAKANPGFPDGRRAALRRQQRSTRYAAQQHAFARACSTRSRAFRASADAPVRLRIRDAHLARSGQAARLQPLGGAGARGRARAERAVRRGLGRCRAVASTGRASPRPVIGRRPLHLARAVREHHPAHESGRHDRCG